MMLTPGMILGDRYEIIEKIGAGGMSIVYKARCNRLQRFVAIKVLREEFVTDEGFVAKFRKEALAAASLSHPNIVGIYDVGSEHNQHYIVMEYVEGKTLKDIIAEEGPFDSKTVLEFGAQIVSAIRHAHKKKIIHRDIKPQNILVTHDNVLKVTDFGIAKAVDSSTVVASGNAIGSVHYFSPEQAKGKYVNETSDLYSCGIVLFELATKKLPFEADSHISIALKHINEDLPMPSQFNPKILPSLEKLILKATHKSQAARYQNADEMLKDMKGILANPAYAVQTSEVSDQTILLTDLETEYIRNNGNKPNRTTPVKNPSVYTEAPSLEKEDEPEEEISTLYKVLVSIGGVLATLVIISLISAALFLWLPSLGKSKDIVVPNLTGKTVEQAENYLKTEKLKLTINVVGEEATNSTSPGSIIRQDPGENKIVKPNTIIEVTLAKAGEPDSEKIPVPDVMGLDRSEAEKIMNDKGLQYTIEGAYDDVIEVGKVIDQIPGASQMIDKNTIIKIIVSKGPQTVLVPAPNLMNMTLQEAQTSLHNAKLQLGAKKEEASDTVEAGRIINQSVSPNKEVEEGSAIDVVISTGKKAEEQPPTDDPNPSGDPSDPGTGLTTKTFTLNIPPDVEDKDVYHVMIKLTTADGSKIVFDQQVQKNQFPLDIPIKGQGSGILDTYFDGQTVPSYQDPIEF